LNTIGPYAAQQLLLYIIRPLIHSSLEDTKSVGIHFSTRDNKGGNEDREIDDELEGPAVTWPLGEILAARHDLQHSRIFNS
jgi:urease accessory protein